MSAQISCRNCAFCRVYDKHGNCRRYPPRMDGEVGHNAIDGERLWAVWPVVSLDGDWCGEWRGSDDAPPPADKKAETI